jgi:hypothetical protein
MRCPHCNEKTAVHDIWCNKCNKQTDVLSNELSAIKSLRATWKNYTAIKGHNYPVGILTALTGWIPAIAIIWLLNFAFPELPKWQSILISNLVWLFFVPVLLLPFAMVSKKDDYVFSIKDLFASCGAYSKYLLFSLASVIFYLILFFVCKGDPILNLVWLVLVVYWLAIVFPVPILMERLKINTFTAIRLAYIKAGDVRWNIFRMIIVLLVGLVITLPFTWMAIRDYTDKLIEYEVFSDQV